MRVSSALTLFAALGGCSTEIRPIELPAELDVGIVASMSGDVAIGMTALSSLDSPVELEVASRGWISVSSWSREDLGSAARFIDSGTAFGQVLGCAPRLPPPTTHYASGLDGSPREEETPTFGRDDLGGECPERELAVDITCGSEPLLCPIDFESASCRHEINLSRCDSEVLSVIADPADGLCLEDTGRCRLLDGSGLGALELDCAFLEGADCRVEIRTRPPAAFKVTNRRVLDESASPPHDALRVPEFLSRSVLGWGRLRDLAVNGDRVMVSVSDQLSPGGDCSGLSGKLLALDRDTLETLAQAAGPCADRVLPYEGGFLTVHWVRSAVVVNLRDWSGSITSTPTVFRVPGESELRPGDVDVDGRQLALTIQRSLPPNALRASLLRMDLSQPDSERSASVDGRALRGVRVVGGTTVVVDDFGDTLLYFDAQLELEDEAQTLPAQGGRDSATVVEVGPYFVVLTEADSPAVHIFSGREDIRRSAFYEIQGDPASVLALEGTALIGGQSRYGTDRRGFVSEIEVPSGRFILGATEVGTGPVTRLVNDGVAGAFGMLPWEGSIVRIERK